MKVTVLAGGTSTEREVSLSSAACVIEALKKSGHEVTALDPGQNWQAFDPSAAPLTLERKSCTLPPAESIKVLQGGQIALIIMHGGQGEDGTVQAVLELAGVPYVGSPPGPSAMAMDKVVSKQLFAVAGVPTPPYLLLDSRERDSWPAAVEAALPSIGLPVIVKPADQGSTIGLARAASAAEILAAAESSAAYCRRILVEKFIRGRELTVGVVAGQALPVLEIIVPGGLYDFQAKYKSHANRYICPAEIPDEAAARAQAHAMDAFRVLGLEDYARIDFLLEDSGALWCLEANNQPGMTDSSLLPKAARVLGLDLSGLLKRLIEHALARRGVK
ncbi:D-alanine--D-alanine ligase [bacterium]|nr:D-alanine--D-alanine ligase [bacterium]